MAITIYDRDGQPWIYERGVSAESDPEFPSAILDILDSEGYVVGRFNSAAWTHLVVHEEPKPSPNFIFNVSTADEGLAVKQGRMQDKQAMQYPKR